MATRSHWKSVRLPRFDRLSKPMTVDVLVIGGGITGITTAYLLKRAGVKVALIERDRMAQVDTGNTTAHLTCVTDTRLGDLVKHFGRDHAQAAWDAGRAAIDQIQEIVVSENIACEFRRVPGFLHAAINGKKNETRDLKRDAELANQLGFPADFVARVPLFGRPGVRFANQAKFHPLKYLAELVSRVKGRGSFVFENTEAREFEDGGRGNPIRVTANGQTITCGSVVIATHVPLTGLTGLPTATMFQTKLAPYTSYAIGAKIPRDAAPEASFWDTSDPYYYLRIDQRRGGLYAIFGGLDHKTGQKAHTPTIFTQLERILRGVLPAAKVDRRWSGQVIETHDGLPFIGETAERQYAATGFAGNGMTFGTLSAMMFRDAIVGRKNPWAGLFSPQRKKLRGATWNYIKENAEYPYYLVKDRMTASEGTSLRVLQRGQGKILRIDGKRVAAYRSPEGRTTLLSPVCTHMGCIVHWNEAEASWDCPCHGSRFMPTGQVIAGPAESPLEPIAGKEDGSK